MSTRYSKTSNHEFDTPQGYEGSTAPEDFTIPSCTIEDVDKAVFNLFEKEEGLDMLFGLIRENLPDRLFETAYALCCDVAAADGIIREPELRLLEEMRYELNIDRLHAAAIERGARARHVTA